MQETGELPMGREDSGRVIGESSSSTNAMEETEASAIGIYQWRDIGSVLSESEQNSLESASAAVPSFDLNEMT